MLKFLDSEKHIRHWQFRVWEDAQEEIIAVVPCDSSSTFDMRPLWENTLNRAKVRILFTGEQPSVHAIPTAVHGNGEKIEIRSLSTRAPSFIMADRDVALAHEVWEPLGESGLLVRVPSLLKIIDLLFGQLWEQTNHAPGFDARATLTDHELNILRMLKEGATDESVARRIGVSQRTIRRKMSDIMRRLGAHSRFEAGTIAAKQGLL